MGRGRKFQSIEGAFHFLKDQIEEHPQDSDLHRRMGNFLRNGGKQDLALPCYLEAIKLNPSDAESYYCISDMLIDEQRYEEAIPYFEQLVPLCRESKMDDNLRRGIFSALLNQAYAIEKETGHKVKLFRLAKPEEINQVKESVTLGVRSFDLSDEEDFEWLYHVFRYGRVPKKPKNGQEQM
jgi:tetratricopeptide (TPR) repeat protein